MMSVGGYRLGVTHRLFARRIRLRSLLVALLAATALAAGVGGNAYAQLGSQVTVVNSGAIQGGSLETFGAGQAGNEFALLNVIGPLTLLGQYSAGGILGSLISPSGVAISPVDEHIYVTDSYAALLGAAGQVLVFSPTANGNSAPEQIIYDPGLVADPNGVAFDVGKPATSAPPSIDTEGDVYVANSLPILPGTCAVGSIAEFSRTDGTVPAPGAFPGPSAPKFVIQGCSTLLFEPVGLFVDETVIDACLASLPGHPFVLGPKCASATNCTVAAGTLCATTPFVFAVPTRRIWAVNRAAGFIGIYAPELAHFLGADDCTGNVCNEPPVGGFVSTVEGAGDPSTPNYLALNQSESKVYVTDITGGAGGPKAKKGRVKTFDTLNIPDCLVPVTISGSTYCEVAEFPFTFGVFDSELSGKATKLYMPMGIGALTEGGGSAALFVANVMANTVLEFGPDPSGDTPPNVIVRGGHTRLNQPAGLALPPVPFEIE